MKKLLKIILVFLLINVSSLNFSSQKNNDPNKSITTSLNEKFAINPQNLGSGYWKVEAIDKNFLLKIEEIKKPFPSFIFQSKKIGKTKVVLKYIENKKTKKQMNYTIMIFPQYTNNQKNINSKKDVDFNLNVETKSNTKNKLSKKVFPKKVITENNNLSPIDKIKENPNRYYNYIVKLYKRKLYHEVINNINSYNNIYPDHSNNESLNLLKGIVYSKLNRHDLAVSWYKELIDIDENLDYKKGLLMLLLGQSYENNYQFDKAKLTYIKILSLFEDPKILSEAHYLLGKLYFKLKDYNKGITELEILINDFPEAKKRREVSLYLLGEMYYKKSAHRDFKKSYHYFRTLVEEYNRGKYSKHAVEKMRYLEKNYIKYY